MSDIKLACDMAEQIKTICDKHGNKPGELINILHEAQHLQGYLPEETQRIIASKLGIPVSKVYGVVTFYTFFTMTPKGKHPISVCMGTACYVRGSEKLLEEFKRVLGIEVGDTTPDGKFSLDCLRCVGACGLAPVVMIGEKVYGRLQPVDVKKIIEAADRDDYPAIVVGEHHLAIHHYTDEVYEIFAKGLGVDCEIFLTDVNELGDEQVLQVTPFCSVEQEALLMPTLRNCTSGRWHPAFTDITAADADKGKGLHAMADYLGLNIEETMAFGDGGNDISIVREAGTGVAMGNAGDNLKQVADYITTHVDEDGVKNALLHFGVI